jgi:multiple sugar transport system permease protein
MSVAPGASLVRIRWFPYLTILPVLAVLTIVFLYPLFQVVVMSFRAVDLGRPVPGEPFVGLANYAEMLHRPQFWQSLWVTIVYTLSVVILTAAGGLVIAQILNAKFGGRALARTLLILPWALPPVVTGLVWAWMFDFQFGVVNYLLRLLYLIDKNLNWMVNPDLALPAVIVATAWKHLPLAIIILLAGLQSISGELYEAAHIDGANVLQRYRYITLPGLRPVLGILLLLETLWNFKSFAYIYMMTGGGPARSTESLVVGVYYEAFQFYKFGYAAALGVIVLLICVAITLVYLQVFITPAEKA